MNILWIPHTGWHIPQRAHLFCRALAERHTVHVTDWVADFTRPADFFSARYLHNFFYRRYRDGKITVHGVPRLAPALFSPFLRRLNTRLFEKLVARLIAEYHINVVVGTFVCPPPRAPRLIFDWFDDNAAYWRAYGRNSAYADEIEAVERAYLQQADAVVAVSSVLAEKARREGARGLVHLIPNGIETSLYRDADGSLWRERFGKRGKIIGVVGNHDKPAELEKVLLAAQILGNAELTFVIAGRGLALSSAQKLAHHLHLANVIFTGPLARAEIPFLLAALDVGLCPYLKTPGDDARSPMRLLQYSAAGLPVVCTDLEEVRRMDFPNIILTQDDPRSLAEGIARALTMPRRIPPQVEDYDIHRLTARYEAVLRGE